MDLERSFFRILCLDGGGIRGVFPAAFLARLEEHLEHPIGRYFDLIAGTVTPVGPSGAGHTIKLLHNMVCHTNFMVLAEAGRLAERAGIPLETAINVFNAGNARSYISEQRFPNHILSGKFNGRSTVFNLAKDLGMADTLAVALGGPNAYTVLTAVILARAVATGLGAQDFTRLYEVYEELLRSPDLV